MNALLESYREKVKGVVWLGQKVESMDKSELLCVIGYLMEQMKQVKEDLKLDYVKNLNC